MDLYIIVQQIAPILACDFTFPIPKFRRKVTALPEIQLLSTLVIAVKLYHPFDSKERYSRSLIEMGVLSIDWDIWVQEHNKYNSKIRGDKPFADGAEINVNEHDIFNMSDLQLDTYLDWYEKTWVDPFQNDRPYGSLPKDLLEMFPTGRLHRTEPTDTEGNEDVEKSKYDARVTTLIAVQNSLKVRGIISEDREGKQEKPVLRLGSTYQRYRRSENLPPHAKAFYDAAAKVAGVTLSTLVAAVYQTEVELQKRETKPLIEESVTHGVNELAYMKGTTERRSVGIEDQYSEQASDEGDEESILQLDEDKVH